MAAYTAHVERMLRLAKVADAKRLAAEIVAFETQIAKAQWSKVANRDAVKTYNRKSRDKLAQLAPGFDWNGYFDAVGAGAAKELIVGQPSYVTAAAKMTDDVPLATWQAWLKWRVISHYASVLSKDLVDANFAFYGTTLHGIPQNRPRWKRGIETVQGRSARPWESSMSSSISPPRPSRGWTPWSRTSSPPTARPSSNLDWLSPQTKEKALAKLATFNPKIGYPKKWRDYSALRDQPRRPGGRPAAGDGLRVESRPGQARQAGGPRRVVYDPADGQRLLQPAA